MAPDVQASRRIALSKVNEALELLTTREQLIFRRIYVEGQSSREVSEELALTEARISQVHARILAKLRKQLNGGTEAADAVAVAS